MKIKFENMSLIYPNGYKALEDINLDIESGEIVALIGSSGAGKTSLISTVPGIWPISEGKINIGKYDFIDGKRRPRMLKRIRKNCSIIFQSKNVMPELSVYDNVKAGLLKELPWYRSTFGGIFTRAEQERIVRSIDAVGLLHLTHQRVSQLSGGQQQRVALARAIVTSPEILLADEPVSALDVINAEKVLDRIKRINKELGVTVIINLHHIDLALKYADRIVGMKDGKVVADVKPTQVTPAILRRIYGSKVEDFSEKEISESLRIAKRNESRWSEIELNEQEHSVKRYKELNKLISRKTDDKYEDDLSLEFYKSPSKTASSNKRVRKITKEYNVKSELVKLRMERRVLKEKLFNLDLSLMKSKQLMWEKEDKFDEKLKILKEKGKYKNHRKTKARKSIMQKRYKSIIKKKENKIKEVDKEFKINTKKINKLKKYEKQ